MSGQGFAVYVVAINHDGIDIKEFNGLTEAGAFCTTFLRDNRDYGGEVHALQGRRLLLKTVQVETAHELVYE